VQGIMLIVWPIVRYDRSREQDCPSNTDHLKPNQPAHTVEVYRFRSDFVKTFPFNGASNDVSVVDVKSRKELRRIKVCDGPWGIAIVNAAK